MILQELVVSQCPLNQRPSLISAFAFCIQQVLLQPVPLCSYLQIEASATAASSPTPVMHAYLPIDVLADGRIAKLARKEPLPSCNHHTDLSQ